MTTNAALIAIIAAAHGEMNLGRIIETLEAARAELLRRRPGTEGLRRDKAFAGIIREMEAARHEQIDWNIALDHIADIDPAGYEAAWEAICQGEEPPASLAWTLQLVLLAALEEENAIA